jgi:hypothetical protein
MSTLSLVNERTGEAIAGALEIAATRRARRQGLLGRDSLERDAALLLAPCCSIHTAFMRFPIDVAFVDRQGLVIRFAREIAPWKIAIALRAHAAIEFPAGALRAHDIKLGDRLFVRPVFDTAAGARLNASSSPLPDSVRRMTARTV